MKAVWYSRFGAAREVLELGELPDPEPGPGEVRVRLVASGVNPVDVKRRRGGRGAMAAARVVPHFDGAGTIDRVGPGVPPTRLGERVWVYEAQWERTMGTAAELVVLDADRAVPLPEGVDFAEGACLGIPAMTAHRCVFADGPVEGATVLVTGGAGAVGRYAVQMAALGGARVLATVSGEEKARLAAEAGAAVVIDYRREDVAARVAAETDGEGVDRIVEVAFGANLPVSLETLAVRGVVAAYASDAVPEPAIPFYRLLYKNAAVRFELVFLMPPEAKRRAVEDITRWLREGRLRHHIGARFPLEETAAAHEAVEAGTVGKVVVDVAPRRGERAGP